MAKHAGEAHVTVTLSCTGQELHLSIQDDGHGFDPDTRRESSGLGLLSMQERARLLAGVVTLRSTPGAGTEVNVRIP